MSRSHAEAMYARDLTCRTLGIALDETGPGRARMSMVLGESMVNAHGIPHGGYVFLLADAAFAYACNSHGPVTVAQQASVTFLRAAEVGDTLVAEAVERSREGRNGLYDVTVTGPGERVIAEFRGHSVSLAGNPFAARS